MAEAKTNKTAGATDATTTAQAEPPEPFTVNGQPVSEEAYYKAAEGAYDVPRLREMRYKPDISTKKHGE